MRSSSSEQRRIKQQQKADARAPLERHKAARMRELGPDHHLLELREIAQTLNLDLERCRELEEATKATVAFSTQHDALCRDVAKRASRKGVKDHDLFDVDDIERDEAAAILEARAPRRWCSTTAARSRTTVWIRTKLIGAASSSERNSTTSPSQDDLGGRVRAKKEAWKRDNVRRVEALWRRKAWARALPRHKLADAPYLAKAAARRPSVGDGAQDLTAPAHRREQRRKKTQKLMSRTAPTNLGGTSAAAAARIGKMRPLHARHGRRRETHAGADAGHLDAISGGGRPRDGACSCPSPSPCRRTPFGGARALSMKK